MARRPRRMSKTLITDSKAKHVTFSKRRSSIFKKASELCTLCAVDMALIVFSPGGKPFSFGHPSTASVLNRLVTAGSSAMNPTGHRDSSSAAKEMARREATMAELHQQLSDLNAQLMEEKKRGKELKKKAMNLPDIEKMNRDELMKIKEKLEGLRQKLQNRREELLAANLTLGGIYDSAGGEASSSSANNTYDYHQQQQQDEGENMGVGLSLSLSAFVPNDNEHN